VRARKPEIPEYSYKTRPGRPVVDPAMRRIAFGAGGISVLVIVVALVWSGMKPGMMFGPIPVINPPPGPLRVVPADPGGLTVPGANEQIMSGAASATPQLAPDAPGPALAQLQQAAGISAPPAPPAPPPAVAPPPATAPAPAVTGTTQVQLAATVDQAGAKAEWSKLEVKMPGLLTGQTPIFMQAVVDGQNIWRLRLGGFADVPTAKAFCAQVIAKGGGCTVAGF
jgi:hypothetical protein